MVNQNPKTKQPKEFQFIVYSNGSSTHPKEYRIRHSVLAGIIGFFILTMIVIGGMITIFTDIKLVAEDVVSVEKYQQDVVKNHLLLDSVKKVIDTRTDYFSRLKQLMQPKSPLDSTTLDDRQIRQEGLVERSFPERPETESYILEPQSLTEFYSEDVMVGTDSLNNLLLFADRSMAGPIQFQMDAGDQFPSVNFTASLPAKGIITRRIEVEEKHFGIDIATKTGSPVSAMNDGTVIFSDWTQLTGYTIVIQHPNKFISVYKHLSVQMVETNDEVSAGEIIALTGNTGTITTGPHLHVELWYNGQVLNPLDFIPDLESK